MWSDTQADIVKLGRTDVNTERNHIQLSRDLNQNIKKLVPLMQTRNLDISLLWTWETSEQLFHFYFCLNYFPIQIKTKKIMSNKHYYLNPLPKLKNPNLGSCKYETSLLFFFFCLLPNIFWKLSLHITLISLSDINIHLLTCHCKPFSKAYIPHWSKQFGLAHSL